MTPEQFMARASVERALAEQVKVTGQQVTQETLQGCLMAAVQMAHALKLPVEDFDTLTAEEWSLMEQYVKARKVLAEKKKKGAK
jgi:hypothetical protein